MNILKDIATAGQVFGEIRKTRKAGASGVHVSVQPTYSLPVIRMSLWTATMEGCIWGGKKWHPIIDLFDTFDEKTQRRFIYAPKPGEFTERVRFWKEQLRPVLPPELYHEAIQLLIRACIRAAKLDKVTV